MPAQPHTTHEVGFDDRHPILIRYLLKRFWFVTAKVVDQNVDFGKSAAGLIRHLRPAQVTNELVRPAVRMFPPNLLDGLGHAFLRPAVDNHSRALASKG